MFVTRTLEELWSLAPRDGSVGVSVLSESHFCWGPHLCRLHHPRGTIAALGLRYQQLLDAKSVVKGLHNSQSSPISLKAYLTLILEITLAARSPFVGPTISHSSRLAWLIIFIFILVHVFFWLQWEFHLRKGLHLLHQGCLKASCQVLRERVRYCVRRMDLWATFRVHWIGSSINFLLEMGFKG